MAKEAEDVWNDQSNISNLDANRSAAIPVAPPHISQGLSLQVWGAKSDPDGRDG